MKASKEYGIAVALAWPQTYCKQAGGWYDGMLKWLHINNGHYYKAGHAALILIAQNGDCQYFDFGRYHSPFGFGRVRGANTDPDLTIKGKALWENHRISNMDAILREVAENPACHGQGRLYASLFVINFHDAFNHVLAIQNKSPIHYGPFIFKGTNCSRFVNSVIRKSAKRWLTRVILRFPYMVTPSPLFNFRIGREKRIITQQFASNCPNEVNLFGVLMPCQKPSNISELAVWHAGEGGGSWFEIEKASAGVLSVRRYNPEGELEFFGEFDDLDNRFEVNKPFSIGYLSHFRALTLIQESETWKVFKK